MRPIKFRAKEKETNLWVYGMLYNYGIKDDKESCAIIDEEFTVHSVYSDSVQQFTGLQDKENKEIYEADILCHKYFNEGYVVEFINGKFILFDVDSGILVTTLDAMNKDVTVVGNYYDSKIKYVH